MLFKTNRISDFVWNPSKYYQKGIIDIVQALILEHKKFGEKDLTQFSWPYLVILQVVMNEPIGGEAIKRQFLVVNSFGFDEHKKLQATFISKIHRI